MIRAVALSYFPGRSGDLIVVPKENWLLDRRPGRRTDRCTRTTSACRSSSTAPGSEPGARNDAATPADLAVTVASLVGVTLPSPTAAS